MTAPAVTPANIITFFVSDPRSVGFSAIRAAHPGDDPVLLAACLNTNGPGSGTVAGDPLDYPTFFGLMSASEWNAMTDTQLSQLASFGQQVDMGDAGAQAKINLLFASFATSLATFQALYTRPAGPWEAYFGKGRLPTIDLIDGARNFGSGNNF